MHAQKGNGIWKWLIALLVLCNLALIATIWLKPGSQPPLPPPRQGPAGSLQQQLAMTPEQQARFDSIHADQRQKIDSLKKLASAIREHFFDGLKGGNYSNAQVDSMAGRLGTYHQQVELETYRHFAAIRQILTDSQRVVFDKTISDVLRRLPEQPHFRGDARAATGQPAAGAPPADNGPAQDERRPHPHDGQHRRGAFGPPPPPPGEGPPPRGDGPTGPPPPRPDNH